MGEAYHILCNDCDFKKDIWVGIGFNHCYPDSAYKLMKNPKIKAEIKNRLPFVVAAPSVYDSFFHCPNCDFIDSKLFVSMITLGTDTDVLDAIPLLEEQLFVSIKNEAIYFETTYSCPNCQTKLENLGSNYEFENISEIPCQQCRRHSLTAQPFMDWD